jgi:hypothetical protein
LTQTVEPDGINLANDTGELTGISRIQVAQADD